MSKFALVAIPPLPKPLIYHVPEELAEQVKIGSLVKIPLGKRRYLSKGFVVQILVSPPNNIKYEIKDISGILSDTPAFTESEVLLYEWMEKYYADSISRIIDTAVPPYCAGKRDKEIYLKQAPEAPLKGKVSNDILNILKDRESILLSELSLSIKNPSYSLRSLTGKGLITTKPINHYPIDTGKEDIPEWAKTTVSLNTEQELAERTIEEAIFNRVSKPFLLYGVTGSGKTEIYLRATKYALKQNYGVLIIVPEIALTPQLIDRFCGRVGNSIAVLHSGLSKRNRWAHWRALIRGDLKVAIGARSAIFAPVQNLGLIVVDEEHDSSFKQSEGLRYNARDLATVRAHLNKCSIILGSATPSLESFYNVAKSRYELLTLPNRANALPSPRIETIDLGQIKKKDMASENISPRLYELLNECLNNNDQAFILYNRRGFASYLQCESCGNVIECPHCSVSLTYHQQSKTLLCHYCNFSTLSPERCGFCVQTSNPNQGKMVLRGGGTEKVFDEICSLFPNVAVDRMDRDAIEKPDEYRKILARVRDKTTNILVGTQMIAKGHDLPGVTLVGIIDCDVGLHFPDFRASERIFQLLTQASGRAGRGDKIGRVILQTRLPRHPSIMNTLNRDFKAFAKLELAARKSLNYPPFSRILRVIATSTDKELPILTLKKLLVALKKKGIGTNGRVSILGPAPAPLQRLKKRWRVHLLLKANQATDLIEALKVLQSVHIHTNKVRINFDLDPQDML